MWQGLPYFGSGLRYIPVEGAVLDSFGDVAGKERRNVFHITGEPLDFI